jgi:hypothetical protein
MKKAEIIKNGNVNLKPIKTGIDWGKLRNEYYDWYFTWYTEKDKHPHPLTCFDWMEKRIEKELQASGSNP